MTFDVKSVAYPFVKGGMEDIVASNLTGSTPGFDYDTEPARWVKLYRKKREI